jgi:hypothetical protein
MHPLARMMRRWLLAGGLPIVLGFGLLSAEAIVARAAAQTISGSGTLKGSGLLAVQRCGRARLRARAQVVVAPDGTWTATTDDGVAFSGTSVLAGTSGRKLDLSFDASSETGFVGSMAGDAAELCRTGIQVTSVTKKQFFLAINKRRSRATLVLRYTGTGIGNGRSGWARSSLRLEGRWTAS